MGLKIKFPKISREQREIFVNALDAYKAGEYSKCYGLINGLAEEGVARAVYCRAILNFNKEIPEAEGFSACINGLKQAMALKYPLAFGMYALLCFDYDEYSELLGLCKTNKKSAEPRMITMLAATYDNFYSEASDIANPKLAAKAYALATASYEACLTKPSEEWLENDAYVGNGGWTLSLSYALLNRLRMISYRFEGVYQNRNLYREAFAKAEKYADSDLFRFGLNRIHADTMMQDMMGLSDLKSVNAAMNAIEDAYLKLTEEDREDQKENYEAIWEQYREYYANESARLASLNIRASDDFQETFKGRGFGDMLGDIAKGVERWANTPTETKKTYYELDGKRYDVDEQGYFRDEMGLRGDYRVDDVGRVYDNSDNEVGYFSTDGIFMPKK